MDFARGDPAVPGKYLAYVKDMASPGWLRPMILSWDKSRWYFPGTHNRYWDPVFLWDGPLPTGKIDDFYLAPMEYDL